jgi:hypothetical protein
MKFCHKGSPARKNHLWANLPKLPWWHVGRMTRGTHATTYPCGTLDMSKVCQLPMSSGGPTMTWQMPPWLKKLLVANRQTGLHAGRCWLPREIPMRVTALTFTLLALVWSLWHVLLRIHCIRIENRLADYEKGNDVTMHCILTRYAR